MKLTKPELKHETIVNKFRLEMLQESSYICGGSSLEKYGYKNWLKKLDELSNSETCPEGFVPALLMIYVDDNETKVYGIINLRMSLNSYLLNYGGHIGYSIVPSERRKGYAKRMLKEALTYYRQADFEKVLITCDNTNIASMKTIESVGGELENIVDKENGKTRRYWVKL